MNKYFGEQPGNDNDLVQKIATDHGGNRLQWPGTAAGFPFRGKSVPHLKQGENDNLPHVLDFHEYMFKMWDEKDCKAYAQVRDRIANGWYVESKRSQEWVRIPTKVQMDGVEHVVEVPYLVIHLEWAQIYGESPKGKHPAASVAGAMAL